MRRAATRRHAAGGRVCGEHITLCGLGTARRYIVHHTPVTCPECIELLTPEAQLVIWYIAVRSRCERCGDSISPLPHVNPYNTCVDCTARIFRCDEEDEDT